MSEIDSEEKQAFDRVYGPIITGVIASNPGGAISKPANQFTDLAATIALAAVKSRAAALEQLAGAGTSIAPVLTQGVTVGAVGSYAGPTVGSAMASATGTAFTPATPLGVSVAAPPAAGSPISIGVAGGAPGGANATPADRTARLGISQETCPVCKGMRNEPSKTQDAQCPIFHFQPYGNLAPQATATPSGPIQPIVTGPTAPISTG